MQFPRIPLVHRIRYSIERLMLAGIFFRLAVLGGFILVLAFIGGNLVWWLAPYPEKSYDETLWQTFLILSDSGYLGDETHPVRRTIYAIWTVLGLSTFVGALVATITQWLNQRIRNLEMGITPVPWNGHILVIGWTTRTPYLLKELLLASDRVNNYLMWMSLNQLKICVLAEEVDSEMVNALGAEIGVFEGSTGVVLRSGDPLDLNHLERGGFSRAKVMVLPTDRRARDEADQDARSIAIAMAMGAHLEETHHMPLLVVEMQDPQRAELLASLYPGQTVVVSSDEILSSLTVQCVAQPGVSHLLHAILHRGRGFGIYIKKTHSLGGVCAGEANGRFPGGVLIGVLRESPDRKVEVRCPSDQDILEAGDQLIFLSTRASGLTEQRQTGTSPLYESGKPSKRNTPKLEPWVGKILIVGWSRRSPILIQKFLNTGIRGEDIISTSIIEEGFRVQACLELGVSTQGICFLTQDSSRAVHWRDYGPELGVVVIQSSDRFAEASSADAHTLSILAVARGSNHRHPSRRYVVELLETHPDVLSGMPWVESLPTSLFMAHILAHTAMSPGLVHVYEQLFDPTHFRLRIKTKKTLGVYGPLDMKRLIQIQASLGERLIAVSSKDGSEVRLAIEGDKAQIGQDDLILAMESLNG